MARIPRALSATLILSLISTSAHAQRGPVFVLQPGLAVSDFISVREGTLTNTAFSLRFETRFPTGVKWLTPVIGAVLLPYGTPTPQRCFSETSSR